MKNHNRALLLHSLTLFLSVGLATCQEQTAASSRDGLARNEDKTAGKSHLEAPC